MRMRYSSRVRTSIRLALVALAACGSGQVTVQSSTQVQQRVEVRWGAGGQGGETIDFEDPRLVAALADTERVIGQRVDFVFDVARMPRPRGPFFEAMFDRQIGRIPLELEALSQRDPALFAFLQENMRQVSFDYNGARRSLEVEYERESGVVRFLLTSPRLGRGAVAEAAEQAYGEMLDERFLQSPLREIEASELALYASWITTRRRPGEDVLLRLSELLMVWERVLSERSGQDEALLFLREEIPSRARRLAEQYGRSEGRDISPLLDGTARDFGRFVTREFNSLEPQAQSKILRALLVRRSNVDRGEDRFARNIFPGLDRYDFGMQIARRWLTAGAGVTVGEGDAQDAMTEFICPRGHGERPLDSPRCRASGGFWHFISYDEALRVRLAETLKEVNDPRLTLTALVGLRDTNAAAMVDVWHRLEDSPTNWRIGARVLGDRLSYDRNRDLMRSLYDEAVGAWRRNPTLRGGYLYILAANEYPRSGRSGLVPFDNFARIFGTTIDQRVLSEFLQVGEGAVLRLPAVWPALARGTGTAVVVPALTRLLDDGPGIMQRGGFRRMDVVGDWLRAMRNARDQAGKNAAQRYLRARLRQHPSEERMLEGLIALTR
ncbi:MAG: hypothetical protein ACI9KE_002187 [Polyangiales bacterium]|jgi:hypothetical protein